jgi:spore maturation protein CgeB
MKIMVAGNWHSGIHEEVVGKAFEALGQKTICFPWHQYFKQTQKPLISVLTDFAGRLQNKLISGPAVFRLNADFLSIALSQKPDAIFIYRGTHIKAETLYLVKSKLPSIVIVGYNNDDPFSKSHSKLLWRHFLKAVPFYDLILAYRHHNIEDFKLAGARHVKLLRSWFVPDLNKPVELIPEERNRFGCDILFAGHYEADGRDKLLERILQEGFQFKLFGPEWDRVVRNSSVLRKLAPVEPLPFAEYNKALCGAKIALCFLSKLNRDTYTRRCFEIPAAGTFMLSEYSDDLAGLYREGTEAEFFRSEKELIFKLKQYVENDDQRRAIAAAGLKRVWADGHDVCSRMEQVLEWILEFKQALG